jgi:UDP-glucose 6-dehydrogenase
MRHLNEARKILDDTKADFEPEQDENAECEIFVGATIGDQFNGTVYTDQTSNMPVVSYAGNKCQFVCYEYRSNAILVLAMKDQTDDSLHAVFKDVYEFLTARGFKPKLNVMDNQSSKRIQKYIKSTGADIQLVNSDDHRVKACERAIQTWKNHWIAGLSTVDHACPLQL